MKADFDFDFDFLLLRRELQQHIPIHHIYAHIDSLLTTGTSLESFQSLFLRHVAPYPIGAGLLKKLAAFLLARFDRIHSGQKYALQDEFVEFLASIDIDNVINDGKFDRYYDNLPTSKTKSLIHVRTSESIISEGTTGFSLWEASVALLALLATDPHRFDDYFLNRRVLELGSGTGLGGLAIASLANPASVLLTDIEKVHNAYTRPNLLLNYNSPAPVDSKILHWDELLNEHSLKFDTIVGCDIVYDPEVCSLLYSVLRSVLSHSNNVKVLLICTLRNPKTFNDFVDDLKNIPGTSVEVSSITPPADFNNEIIILKSTESFRIIKLFKN